MISFCRSSVISYSFFCFFPRSLARREQKKRALTAAILKLQIISQKMTEMMLETELNFNGFKLLLSKTAEVVTENFEYLNEVC
jgi:hypothetical protein